MTKIASVLMGCLVACSCSASGAGGSMDGGDEVAAPDGNIETAPTGDGASDAASPAMRALDWVLEALNGGPLTESDVAARFAPAFLAKVPVAQLIKVLQQLSAARPFTLVGLEGPATDRMLVAVVTTGSHQYLRIAVATDAAGRMQTLLLQPAGDLDPSLSSWNAVDQAVSSLAPKAHLMAATITDSGCAPTHALGAEASLAIGSSFKLWVLAALAREIGSGAHAWTDTLPIADAHKSLPSGVLQDQPAGTPVSLLELANNMISISDNTAADHLLFFLGRPTVEAMLATTAHHDPTLNQPFLSTRDMFNLKLMVTPAQQQAYIAAGVAERRMLLQTFDATYDPRTYLGPAWLTPRAIDTLEWFATPADLCNVMRALKTAADQPPTARIRDVLSLNPGLANPGGAFSYVGFKGGSEPGVLNMTWLLQRKADQKWLFFTLTFNDVQNAIDEDQAIYLAGAARSLLAAP
ncbi:MAG TPA: serine hydrolase [Polyangia bacterium]|nr:serine hydrolase [Polyangia bacterium]